MNRESANYFEQPNKCISCQGNLLNYATCFTCGGKFCRNNPNCGGVVHPYAVKNLDPWYQETFKNSQYVCKNCMPPAFRTASKISADNYYDILFSEIFRDSND